MLVDCTNQRRAGRAYEPQFKRITHVFVQFDDNHCDGIWFPIALASGAGAEWKNGLAWVIIGGLISSLFLTLIIVP
jgi:HAE1 family hydrophobic/amphiphilic exporter-1